SQDIKKVICITVDDLPYITKVFKDIKTGQYITEKLLAEFKKYNVIALGSVNSGKLIVNDELDTNKINILNQWLESGMILANHTFSHKDYNKIFLSEFKEDILDGELYLKYIRSQNKPKQKYFRHPLLHRGDTKEKADSLQYFLDSLGYTVAPVTIDNSDYIFSWAYEKALANKNDSLAKIIGRDYVNYMCDVLDYYESQSISLLGYNVKHIILTHANLLNADYLDELLRKYSEKGYKFISIDEALKDDCYTELKDEFYKKSGISWLHRWALTMGKRGDFFRGEPEVPSYINELIK
ncbi:MAG: polysaccharide deacetylase family protein, partial [Ignavibacteria bacterium]